MLSKLRTRLAAAAAALAVAVSVAPASAARSSYVQDGASMFTSDTISTINSKVSDFNRATGKEVVVVTVPSLDGASAEDAAEKAFATQQVNGVLIFIAKAERKDGLIPDRASAPFFPSGSLDAVRQAMRGYFRQGDFNGGILNGVNLVLDTYRSHESSLHSGRTSYAPAAATSRSNIGGGMSLIWLVLILIAGFLVIRAIFRAITGPRMMPPGYGGPGYGGPGYGGPGYGGMGYGGGMGGGGSFFSGLLGGLGGAWLGNELFNNRDNSGGGYGQAGFDPGGQSVDSSGWQSDPGQADMGNSSFGDFGGGGSDFGGGGGGDSGGGW